MERKSKRILAGMMAGFSVLSTQSVLVSFQKLPMGGGCNLISYAAEGDSSSTETGEFNVELYVGSDVGDIKTNKGKLIYKINFANKKSNFAINTILRNSGVIKAVADEDGKTDVWAKDVTTSPLKIQDTAKFFKTKGNNLIEFKLAAKYTDLSGKSKSVDLALNPDPDKEYIATYDDNNTGLQEGNTYQIINTKDVNSKLYWGSDAGADKLIFEIPIELPEQVKVGSTDCKIESFEVLVPYSNEDYLERRPLTEQLTEENKCKGITYTLKEENGNKTAAVKSYDNSGDGNVIIPEYVKDTGGKIYAVTSIADATWSGSKYTGSFAQSSNLQSVVIGKNVTTIGRGTFSKCGNLISVKIPDSVKSIGNSAFASCSSLKTAEIGNGLESIGIMAFDFCSSLSSITTLPKSVTSIADTSFRGCSSLQNINVDSENANYTSEDGVLFNKEKTSLLTFPSGKGETSYSIPDSVTEISSFAFYSCSSLNSVTIPNSVTKICDFAFYSCSSLNSVEIGNGLQIIDIDAFSSCYNLNSVEIGNGLQIIDIDAFSSCYNLNSVTIKSTQLNSIGSGAFSTSASITFYVPTGQNDNYKTLLANSTDMNSFPDYCWSIIEQ